MRRLPVLLGILAALVMPAAALAANFDESSVTLTKGDNRSGNYYVSGQSITVDGDVAGDVVCGGQTVVINGSVGGDVLCGAQTLTINGTVTGSVRGGGQVVNVNGPVGRNITVAAQSFVLGSAAKVGGDVAVAAQSAVLNGPVDLAVYLAAETAQLNSTVGGDVTAYVESMKLGGAAAISGNLDYTSDQTITVDNSKVKGKVARHVPETTKSARDTAGSIFGMILYWLAAGLLGALLAIWLLPRMVRGVTNAMMRNWQSSLLWGLVALLVGPLALIVLAVSVIGLPIAAVLGILWFLAILTSGLFAGVAVGRLAWQREDSNRRALALSALVGVPLVLLASWIPFIGGLVGFGATIWTLGGMLLALNKARALG